MSDPDGKLPSSCWGTIVTGSGVGERHPPPNQLPTEHAVEAPAGVARCPTVTFLIFESRKCPHRVDAQVEGSDGCRDREGLGLRGVGSI